MYIEYKLVKFLDNCYISDEKNRNDIEFKKGTIAWMRFGCFGNGGWPQVYVDGYKDPWFDITIDDDFIPDGCSTPIAEEIYQNKWTEKQNDFYKFIRSKDMYIQEEVKQVPQTDEDYWKVCEEVEQVLRKYDVYVKPSEIAYTIADWMKLD